MKSPCILFLFLILVGCSPSLTLTPTQYTLNGREGSKQLDPDNPQLETAMHLRKIEHSFWGRKAIIDVQGWYSSHGLQARRLHRIQTVQEIDGNHLTLICYVEPQSGLGKEANLVYGYNYQQEIELKIPAEIQQLHFKLIEQNAQQEEVLSFKSTLNLANINE